MGLGDKFKNIVDKTVDKIDDNITRAGEDDSEHIARYCKDLGIGDAVKEKALAALFKKLIKIRHNFSNQYDFAASLIYKFLLMYHLANDIIIL